MYDLCMTLKHVNVGNLYSIYCAGKIICLGHFDLYIRVSYILFDFYKRVFEFMCMKKEE